MLMKTTNCVNNYNTLIYRHESNIFARGKHRFLLLKAKGASKEADAGSLKKGFSLTVNCQLLNVDFHRPACILQLTVDS